MGEAREVFVCGCPAPNSALGRRKRAIEERARAREAAGLPPIKNRRVRTPAMARKVAEGLLKGQTAAAALREAGYSPNTVHHAKSAINKTIRAALRAMGGYHIKLGKNLTSEEQELLVRGMLMENVLLKTDAGVQNAKQLGADKRVSMWRPDSQVGLMILRPPPDTEDRS